MSLIEMVEEAGVVGAGGAGFPAHVKIDAEVEYVIANGTECEPLLYKDSELMVHEAEQVVKGLQLVTEATGATHGIIALKEKNTPAVAALQQATSGTDIKMHLVGDYYPMGDEFVLVYEVTGRLIPPGGIPLNIGVIVSNVESLYNIAAATRGKPVISKFITVTGAVKQPISLAVPVGTSFREAIDLAGGVTVDDYAVFVGGVMMGDLERNLDSPITKTMAGLIVLPSEHHLIERKARPADVTNRIGKSACDQCRDCTELCPRYLLGYDVQPHRVMRSLGQTDAGVEYWSQWSYLCCACGLCTLFSCPEELHPKEACDTSRDILRERGIEWKGESEQVTSHIMQPYRRIPIKLLSKRLGLMEYDRPAPLTIIDYTPQQARLPLSQHIGMPAEPIVKIGEAVQKGQVIAEIPADKLGARIHASIDGTVTGIDNEIFLQLKRFSSQRCEMQKSPV